MTPKTSSPTRLGISMIGTMSPSTRMRHVADLALGLHVDVGGAGLARELDEHADGVGAVGGAAEDVGGVAVGVDDADDFGDLVLGGEAGHDFRELEHPAHFAAGLHALALDLFGGAVEVGVDGEVHGQKFGGRGGAVALDQELVGADLEDIPWFEDRGVDPFLVDLGAVAGGQVADDPAVLLIELDDAVAAGGPLVEERDGVFRAAADGDFAGGGGGRFGVATDRSEFQ